MKNRLDPRHKKREAAIRILFGLSFRSKNDPRAKAKNSLADKVAEKQEIIDKIIAKAAPEWPINQINRIDLTILRLAVYELMIAPKEPSKVIIDEAIELAKSYGSEKSPGFVNGALGTILNNHENKQSH